MGLVVTGVAAPASQQANKGVSVRLLASLVRHANIATTQRYIEVNDDMKRKAVELVNVL
jgi:site-specific recombinase XerD